MKIIKQRAGSSLLIPVIQMDADRHHTVDDCRHGKGSTAGRDALCAICQNHMRDTDSTVVHSESTNLLTKKPNPTVCPLCRGEMKAWKTLGCDISSTTEALEAAEAIARDRGLVPSRMVPRWERASLRKATQEVAAQNDVPEMRGTRNATLRQSDRITTVQQRRAPSIDHIRSLIPARGIYLSELMHRLITPEMHPSIRAATQRRVLAAGKLESATGLVMPY